MPTTMGQALNQALRDAMTADDRPWTPERPDDEETTSMNTADAARTNDTADLTTTDATAGWAPSTGSASPATASAKRSTASTTAARSSSASERGSGASPSGSHEARSVAALCSV